MRPDFFLFPQGYSFYCRNEKKIVYEINSENKYFTKKAIGIWKRVITAKDKVLPSILHFRQEVKKSLWKNDYFLFLFRLFFFLSFAISFFWLRLLSSFFPGNTFFFQLKFILRNLKLSAIYYFLLFSFYEKFYSY